MRSLLDMLDQGYTFRPGDDWQVIKADGTVYTVDRYGQCDCPAFRRCSHLEAVDALKRLLPSIAASSTEAAEGRPQGCLLVKGDRWQYD